MNVSTIILHTVFLVNILFLFTQVSRSLSKLILILILLSLALIAIFQRKLYKNWTIKSLHHNGFFFLLLYMFSVLMGFVYGYDFKYVVVNLLLVAPLFLFLLPVKEIRLSSLFNIVLFYSFVTMIFSYVELFAIEKIPFLYNHLLNSFNDNGISNILDKNEKLRLFGIFNDAVVNGFVLVFGFIILLERTYRKFKWHYLIGLLLILIVIYFTYTRNNYLALTFSVFIWFLLTKLKKYKYIWYTTITTYVIIILGAISWAYIQGEKSFSLYSFTGDSIQARVISWAIIINDYIINNIFSVHFLFGYGLTQFGNEESPDKSYWMIDNSVLMVYLGSGILGLILFFSWLKSAVKLLLSKYQTCSRNECAYIKILIVMLCTYIVNGAMNANILYIEMSLPLLLMLSRYTRFKR